MSRTDVHTPYRVKARDPEWRHWFRESHTHHTRRSLTRDLDGAVVYRRTPVLACDLDEFLAGTEDTACTMVFANRRVNIFCGCTLCTGAVTRRLARRQERVAWRSTRARLLACAPQDRDAVDVHPCRRRQW